MENRPCFSIVMPVYNAAPYLERAVQSVLKQSFYDLELILVDDGSMDTSKKICDGFAKLDHRVAVTSTISRCGVSNARNMGLGCVHGRYLSFVDADDWIDVDVLQNVYARLERTKAQVLKYGYVEEYYDAVDRMIGSRRQGLQEHAYTDQKEIRSMIIGLEQKLLFGYLWNTFYDVDFLREHQLFFDLQFQVNEDFMFNMQVFKYVSSLVCMDSYGYHYAKRVGKSLSTKKNILYREMHMPKVACMLSAYEEWGLLTDMVQADIFWLYTRYVYSSVCRAMEQMGMSKASEEWREILDTSLFARYRQVDFSGYSYKQRVLTGILQHQWEVVVLLSCRLMNFVKSHFRMLFAFIKG